MIPCRIGSRTAGSECVSEVRHRLDNELVLRGLARSRRHAADLVVSGRVFVDELPVTKTSTPIAAEQQVSVEHPPDAPDFASRGGYKLAGVLDRLGPGGPLQSKVHQSNVRENFPKKDEPFFAGCRAPGVEHCRLGIEH